MKERGKLLEWCMGDVVAADFLLILGKISQLADDLADGDIQANPVEVARLLHLSMVELSNNRFYAQNSAFFIPIFSTSLIIWSKSDDWKQSNPPFGFVYREILEQAITMTATLIGGFEHGRKVTEDVNDFYHSNETLEQWVGET